MTTDREQHELAAKAAGLAITWKEGHCKGGPFEAAFIGDQPWRPEDDDGDAFRLGVRLNVFTSPRFFHFFGIVRFGRQDRDDAAATRLAIFRAAVEIGRSMP